MHKGNIIRIAIDRNKYNLPPSQSKFSSILVGTVITVHKHNVSVKIMDFWTNGNIKYLTIKKSEIIAVI